MEKKADFGKVTFEGEEFTFTKDFAVDNVGTEGDVAGMQKAVDKNGNEVKVIWSTTKKWNEHKATHNDDDPSCDWCEDETNAFDLENPSAVIRD